jgi:predicted alpha/beta superfamily hydrolase
MLSDDGEEWADIKKRILPEIREGRCRPFVMASFSVTDWSGEFSPWPFTEDSGRVYAGNADKTLDFVRNSLIPALKERFELTGETYIAGYSLAGLAALYGCCSGGFDGCACCSGSVWYPGWTEYLSGHLPGGRVYLSLGKKEERTRHPLMSKVGDCMRECCRIITNSGGEATLFMEPGNHFYDVPGRLSRGVAWLIAAGNDGPEGTE